MPDHLWLALSSLLGLSCLWLHLASGLGGVTKGRQPLFGHHSVLVKNYSCAPLPTYCVPTVHCCRLICNRDFSNRCLMWLSIIAPLHYSDLSLATFASEIHPYLWSDLWRELCVSESYRTESDLASSEITWSTSCSPGSDSALVGSVWHLTNQLTSVNGSLDCLKSFSSHVAPLWFLSGKKRVGGDT